MKQFERDPVRDLVAGIDPGEAQLLRSLVLQVAELVTDGWSSPGDDPALQRLFPDAYRGDSEKAAEFRRYTAEGLGARKVANAQIVMDGLGRAEASGVLRITEQEAQAWLRSLTDIRLTVAARLDIRTEDDDAGADVDPVLRDIYDWLGFVQNSVVEALDG